MARAEQAITTWIDNLPSAASIAASDKFITYNGATVKTAMGSDVQALVAQPTSIGDYNIGTAAASLVFASAFSSLAVGASIRYSWYGGDGTNTISWSDGASYTINGITLDNYVGQGTGHLDIIKTATTTGAIINAGEIWDSDGGNFSDTTWRKTLSGIISYDDWTYEQGDGTAGVEPVITVKITPTQFDNIRGTGIGSKLTSGGAPSSIEDVSDSISDMDVNIQITDTDELTVQLSRANSTFSASRNYAFCYGFSGRWTTSYPRIT